MARRTKVLLTCLALLALALGGGATWYYWLLRSTTNPLHLRIVKVESAPDGGKMVHFELTNDSWFDLKFLGAVSTYTQPLDSPLSSSPERAGLQSFPPSDVGPQLLRARQSRASTMHAQNPVSCAYDYQWEPQLVGSVRSACREIERKLPKWLEWLVPMPFNVREGHTGDVPIPISAPTTATKPEPQER
jgi:hypothetical protein